MLLVFKLQLIFLISILNYTSLQRVNPLTQYWDYQREGPDTWQQRYNTCNGRAQSPINIQTCLVKYDKSLNPLCLNDFMVNTSLYVWNFTHNGHTIVVYPPTSARLSISGANLSEIFYLVQFHFHWGYNAYQGSEHTIDGIKYPLEIHFVYEAQFSSSLAVLCVLFNLQVDDNPYINDLLSILNQTRNASIAIERQIDISPLFPTFFSPRFYRYIGSLTTPPCTEGIIWIILASTVPISENQLKIFIDNSAPSNFRDPQNLNSRNILANFEPEKNLEVNDDYNKCIQRSSVCIEQRSIFLISLVLFIFILQ
ncbi:unnamed protein product [Rotaria socialis]|uniref:Carbonic anhydrase n=1 Tax=Rotaria socialis TaxID=392032 RepID=A0A819WM72_9BILA|nr:unnamed protein product [Rotaria socialis]CAF3451344.1 unnamed protein product [Rotaria socialis]CAF3690125.1 unnamed protein product [Rotaria socialis]CAF4126861.1 unnamed protein product [Rotaria socialis]CAF4194640.1 unnamed protein product [Rotaria socialis]